MPGRWMPSGSSSPGSTSSSTCAMQTRPAIAASGLKLRADLLKTRLPCRSPRRAWTRAKSVTMASSSTNSRGSPSRSKVRTSFLGDAIAEPPARSFSASVPCGVSSSSSSPERNCRSNSLFSPTYDDVILRMRLAFRSTPSPQSSTPQLLLTMLRSVVPCASSASMRAIGLPESPKPPTARLAPSGMSATASAADPTVLSITCHSFVARAGPPLRGRPSILLRAALPGRGDACHVDAATLSVHIVDATSNRSVPGAQSVARAARVLRLVTSAGDEGIAVAELARRAELTRPTAHRLLTALRHEGLVDQDERTGRWMPGPELYLMGTVAASRYDITAIARDIVRSLAVRTEESAFLSVRRGDETVCLMREEGSFPIRSFVLSEGVRFPLGVASAGLAILSFLPPHDVDAYFERHPELSDRWGASHSEQRLRTRLKETQARGYAVNPGLIVEGSYGIGAAAFTREGHPQWALSLTGVQFRFGPDRLPELGRTLLAHAHQLTTRIAAAR